jgi:outer membrane protein
MKQSWLSIVLLMLISSLFASSVSMAANDFVYVDMDRVLKESQLGRAAEQRLQEQFGDDTTAFATEEQAIRQAQQALERDKPLMSQAQLEKKEAEIKTRIRDFEKKFSEVQRELMKVQQEEARKILQPAKVAIEAIGQQMKVGAIFEKNQSGMLYLDPKRDITDQVIQWMNKQ